MMKLYSKPTCLLMLLTTLSAQHTLAQNLNNAMPDDVPQLFEDEAAQSTMEPAGVTGSELSNEVLVEAFTGIVIVADPSLIEESPTVSSSQPVLVKGETVLPDDELTAIRELFIGQPISRAMLDILEQGVTQAMNLAGHPFSLVYLPPQDISEGVVQVVAQPSALSSLEIEGANYFSEQDYLRRLPLVVDNAIDQTGLSRGLDRINANPFRRATLSVAPGDEPATSQVVVQVQEMKPWRFYVGANNQGTRTTGDERLTLGMNWGNVFGRGYQGSLQLMADPDFKRSRTISGDLTFDLWNADALTVFGAYSEIEGDVPAPLDQEGKSYQLGSTWSHNLASANNRFQHSVQGGIDYKYSDNNLDFLFPGVVVPVVDNATEVFQGSLTYQASYSDPYGDTRGRLKVTASPGELFGKNSDEAFDRTRSGATSDYAYATLDITRNTPLTAVLPGWNWQLRGSYQQANGNLLGSEQFSGGGTGRVRGYEEGEVIGDEGYLLSQELQMPAFSLIDRFSASEQGMDQFRLYVFQDYASVWNVDRLPGESTYQLHSVGLGFRYNWMQRLSISLEQGFQLKDSGSSVSGDNGDFHLSVQVSF